MNPESVFQLCNTIALVGWIILLFFPFWLKSDRFILGTIISLFCVVYAWLVLTQFQISDFSKFGSLEGVMELFRKKEIVVAGWVHYLAFDLLAGLFIKRNAIRYGISHWLLVPVLLLTFMLGPLGLLLYLIIRMISTKHYFSENF